MSASAPWSSTTAACCSCGGGTNRSRVGALVDVLDRIRLAPDGRTLYHYVLIDFVCRRTAGTLCCGSDATEAASVSVADLPDYHLAAATFAMIHKALDRLAAGPWRPRDVPEPDVDPR
ncbi:MAG: hypothetical protein DMF93_07630 [Acidobacteria bacterium]|nr:MAG: hypothetical protein DMF93_07630 [Acidobacteriota bacterium]